MTETPELVAAEIEIPQYSIMADKENGFLALIVACSGTMSQHFLCLADDYIKTAGTFREMIMKSGRDLSVSLKQKPSGLVVMKDMPDALRNGPSQGRQPR